MNHIGHPGLWVSKKIIIFGFGQLSFTIREQANDKGLHNEKAICLSFIKSVYHHTTLVYGLGRFHEAKNMMLF